MIATPSPGVVKVAYVGAVVGTIADLAANGAGWTYSALDTGDLIYQRNKLATRFLDMKHVTHLFFVDSDMSFRGDVCRRLLVLDKPLVGAIYSTRDPDASRRFWHAYSVDGPTQSGAAKCEAVALGCALIRRDALETMVERKAAVPQSYRGERLYNFFGQRAADAATGVHTSEDFSFCQRWRIDCGGEIWAYLDAKIGHIGDYAYGADQSYLDYLKEKGAFTPQGV